MTKLALIVAMDAQRGISKDNDLMWNLPNDMKFFKETTAGQVVIMGRKNYESIPTKYRPLPHRENCVITRNTSFVAPGCKVFSDLSACVHSYQNDVRKVFIIGGGEIYRHALNTLDFDEIFITKIEHVFGADTFLAAFDESAWKHELIFDQRPDARHPQGFTIHRYFK